MFWSCKVCNGWVTAETTVDLAVEKQRHIDDHMDSAEELAADGDEGTVDAQLIAWCIALGLGLLSRKWEALAVVAPFAAMIAWGITYREGGK